MAKTFELNFLKGSLTERYNGYTPSTNCPIVQTEKGLAINSINNVQALFYASGGKVPFGTGDWTIEFWAQNNSTSGTKWYFGQGGSGIQGVNVYSASSTVYCAVQGSSGTNPVASVATGFKIGKFHHIVVTCNRTTNFLTVYIDGVAGTPVNISGAIGSFTRTGSDTAFLSYQTVNADTMTGRMAYFALYNEVLSTQQINAEYAEFLSAQPINKPKRGFIQNKASDLSRYVRDTISTTDVLSGWTFLSTWTAVGATVINSAVTFTTVATSGIYKAALGSVGDVYNIRIKGTTTASNLNINDAGGSNYFSVGGTGAFDVTRQITWAGDRQLFLSTVGAGVTTIEILTLNKVTGLLAAYNMVKNGNTLVDISGNGYVGTIDSGVTQTTNGLNFPLNKRVTTNMPMSGRTMTLLFKLNKKSLTTVNRMFYLGSSQFGWGSVTNSYCHISSSSGTDTNALVAPLTALGSQTIAYTVDLPNNLVSLYANGVFVQSAALPTSSAGSFNSTTMNIGDGSQSIEGVMEDVRFYNRILSAQEIKNYHNSFVLPAIVEDFADAGADGITKSDAPREWERVSGTWKVGENVVSNTQMIVGGPNFSTNVGWNLSGATISGGIYTGTSSGLNYCTSNVTLVAGKRYKIDVNILTSSNNAKVYVGGKNTGVLPVGFSTVYVVMDTVANQLVGFNDLVGTSDYLSITEAPQLDTMINGTKYLENVSSGVIGIPSTTAYGSWEFDWYKASTSNSIVTGFISTTRIPTTTGTQGYVTEIGSDEALYLYAFTGSGFTSLMSTAISYIANSTWYRVRITRTTAGVFTVLIKGGAFTPTAGYDGWTLVSVSGGAGTNPVTNTTYTVSNYFTVDLDAGDRVANIVIRDSIKI